MKSDSFLSLLFIACASCSTAGPAAAPHGLARYEERRVAMGVDARIVLYADSRERALDAFEGAFARIERLDDALSDWKPTSELSRLCDGAGGPPREVSADLYAALERSLAMARASGGAFDPAIGPLVAVWRQARADGRVPAKAAIEAALPLSRWEKIEIDPAHRTVRLAEAGMRLDLGAIGKGIACDEALAILRSKHCGSALVELGGDLAVGDPPPAQSAPAQSAPGESAPGEPGWKVAAGSRVIVVANESVSTSGDAAQRLEVDGVRYSHVVDPRTGMGVTGGLIMTVIAPDGATADALSTAAGVLGPEEGGALVASQGGKLLVDDPRTVSLFDGKTLAGWVTKGGRYDGPAVWTIEDGALVGRVDEKGEGGLIYTEKPYTSFVFECEAQMDYPFDSGVFVRMVPPDKGGKGAQITLDDRPEGEIAAIYADGFLQHNDPTPGRFWKRNAWNHVKVEVTGFDMHIRAWINDALAVDYKMPANTEGYAPTGLIGLQVHGGMGEPKTSAARFRGIRIRELPVFGEDATAGDVVVAKGGWTPLFDGKSLGGWDETGTVGGWRVHDGVLGCLFGKEGGDLRTKEDFQDFDLRLEFKTARMANSGVFLRAARDDTNPAYSGCEIQILDDFDWEKETNTTLKDWQLTGSLYGSVAAGAKGTLHAIGEWNSYEILYRGRRLAVALNGRTLYDVDVDKVPGDPPFAKRAKSGFIGLQHYVCAGPAGEDVVSFRNVSVRR